MDAACLSLCSVVMVFKSAVQRPKDLSRVGRQAQQLYGRN